MASVVQFVVDIVTDWRGITDGGTALEFSEAPLRRLLEARG